MYLDQKTGEIASQSEISNAAVGLTIRNRRSQMVKITIEADVLGFQIGETAQILSGGILQATPHAVLTDGNLGNLSRNTFAVFMEPRGNYLMKCHDEKGAFIEHNGVPSLQKRWKAGITFGEFHRNTINFFN